MVGWLLLLIAHSLLLLIHNMLVYDRLQENMSVICILTLEYSTLENMSRIKRAFSKENSNCGAFSKAVSQLSQKGICLIYHTGDLTRVIVILWLSNFILLFCTASLALSLNYVYLLIFLQNREQIIKNISNCCLFKMLQKLWKHQQSDTWNIWLYSQYL